MTRLAIASDHAGYDLKEAIREAFGSEVDWLDLGAYSNESVSYADYGHAIAKAIAEGKAEQGVAICGSGIGIGIAANRHRGIRAALATNSTMARLARSHNDANILVLGSRITGREVALDCLRAFMETRYEGGRHQARIEAIDKK